MNDDLAFKADMLQRNMETLALRLTGQAHATLVDPWESDVWFAVEHDGCIDEAECSVWYLGGGYWRARVVRHTETHSVLKVRLINPDLPHAKLDVVQRAMQYLNVIPPDVDPAIFRYPKVGK